MSFPLSFLAKSPKLTTIADSISAFEESLRANDFSPQNRRDSLNKSRRTKLNLNKFLSMKLLEKDLECGVKTRHSFVGFEDIDYSGRTTLLEDLQPTPEKSIEDPHFMKINAKKIFIREARKSKTSTFETPKFQDDIGKLLVTQRFESKRCMVSSTRSDLFDVMADKKVTFIDITVREYPIIVGDNPAGSGGPPVTIGWNHVSSIVLDIDKYEEARAGHRRKQEEMKMRIDYRQKLLRRLGFSMVEMQKGTKAATIVRNRRRRMNASLCRDRATENIENVTRWFVTIVTLGVKQRKETRYLRRYRPNYANPL